MERFPKTTTLQSNYVHLRATDLLNLHDPGKWLELRQCESCRMWVIDGEEGSEGHAVKCESFAPLATEAAVTGWHINLKEEEIPEIVKTLVGLEIQVRQAGGMFFLAPATRGSPETEYWELAEGFMRLGFLPPADIARELQELPLGEHGFRRLWTLRGARRTMRLLTEHAEREEDRVTRVMHRMFPRGKSQQHQAQLPWGDDDTEMRLTFGEPEEK